MFIHCFMIIDPFFENLIVLPLGQFFFQNCSYWCCSCLFPSIIVCFFNDECPDLLCQNVSRHLLSCFSFQFHSSFVFFWSRLLSAFLCYISHLSICSASYLPCFLSAFSFSLLQKPPFVAIYCYFF